VARLQDHAQLQAAQRDLAGVMAALAREHPDALGGRTVTAMPLKDALLGNMKATLTGLLIAVALLLVIMGAILRCSCWRGTWSALRSSPCDPPSVPRARAFLRQLLFENLAPSLLGAGLALAIGQIAISALRLPFPKVS